VLNNRNYIHDDGVEAIAKGVGRNNQSALERLYLGWNTIGDEGTIALAAMLEENTSLQVVGLTENEIGNAGARALLSSMDVNVSLREISGL
jgi:Ran GTPase-activating protein (RanGAP) involved in mRNA processing and transport